MVPETWELHTYQGNRDAGYAALDDGRDLRLQVRWNPSKRVDRAHDLDATVQHYRRALVRKCKGAITFDVLAPGFVPGPQREDCPITAFHWNAREAAFGLAWHCRTCRRVVLLEVLFPRGQGDRNLARRILGSASDHREDDQCLWSVYGFAFLAPTAYNLHRADLVPGRLRFLLRESRRSWLTVERWALASLWANRLSLEQWPKEVLKLMRISRRGPLDQTETQVNEHPACRFTATVARRGLVRREPIEGLVWACPAEDKVFMVMAAQAHGDLIEKVAGSVPCQ
jgi:hypothetical protein